MYNDPEESPEERAFDPATRAREKSDEFRMHAELAAVYEGPRKFDAQLIPSLSANTARDIQRAIAKLDKSKSPESPILPDGSVEEARRILNLPRTLELSTNDYHIHRRPGEVMMVRWLEGEEIDLFYKRMQAHFDVAMDGCKEDEQQDHAWQKDAKALAYLAALDAVNIKMADTYLREFIRTHRIFVLSTQTADEMNIAYLTDHIMGVSAEELVGERSAPGDEPSEQDLAWFFKMFALRGMLEETEKMCFFTYLQKSDDGFE